MVVHQVCVAARHGFGHIRVAHLRRLGCPTLMRRTTLCTPSSCPKPCGALGGLVEFPVALARERDIHTLVLAPNPHAVGPVAIRTIATEKPSPVELLLAVDVAAFGAVWIGNGVLSATTFTIVGRCRAAAALAQKSLPHEQATPELS